VVLGVGWISAGARQHSDEAMWGPWNRDGVPGTPW